MPHWPAIIHYQGDAELAFVPDRAAWENDADLHRLGFQEGDRMIDSDGEIFLMTGKPGRPAKIRQTGQHADLDTLSELVRAHAAQVGNCCIAKFAVTSATEAVLTIQSLS
jgi:hypothetical protein